MSHPQHQFHATIKWTGNQGTGTSGYRAYNRNHLITGAFKSADILGSSDAVFRGDKTRYNPEELLVASLSSCHMLWYLHLCAEAGVIVVDYQDHASGTMLITEDGGGYFTEVTLRPEVTLTDPAMQEKALHLHEKAHALCFIANSVKFPVYHQALFKISEEVG